VEAVDIPVTVKIRSGWDENSKNAPEIAMIAEKAGAAAVAVHGRTREQLYRPPSDNSIIREVKRAVSIPVIGNGGLESAADMLRMYEETGCDGVMIARGACGNPWIFRECIAALVGKIFVPPEREEIISTLIRHINLLVADKGERTGVAEARKHVSAYIKCMPGAASMRDKINSACTAEAMLEAVEFFKNNP